MHIKKNYIDQNIKIKFKLILMFCLFITFSGWSDNNYSLKNNYLYKPVNASTFYSKEGEDIFFNNKSVRLIKEMGFKLIESKSHTFYLPGDDPIEDEIPTPGVINKYKRGSTIVSLYIEKNYRLGYENILGVEIKFSNENEKQLFLSSCLKFGFYEREGDLEYMRNGMWISVKENFVSLVQMLI